MFESSYAYMFEKASRNLKQSRQNAPGDELKICLQNAVIAAIDTYTSWLTSDRRKKETG